MNKIVSKIIFGASLLLLAACSKDEMTDNNALPEGQYPLEIASVAMNVESSQLIRHNLFHFRLDAVVILLNLFLHAVVALLVREIGNDGNLLVGFLLFASLIPQRNSLIKQQNADINSFT